VVALFIVARKFWRYVDFFCGVGGFLLRAMIVDSCIGEFVTNARKD
jgi:hypothetical protein